MDRVEIRRRNFIQPDAFPFKMPAGNIYDSGDYPKVLDQALTMAGWDELKTMQAEARAQGRLVGIGLATAQQRSVYGADRVLVLVRRRRPHQRARERRPLSRSDGRVHRRRCSRHSGATARRRSWPRGVGEEFGIDPSSVTVTYEDSLHGLPSAGPAAAA